MSDVERDYSRCLHHLNDHDHVLHQTNDDGDRDHRLMNDGLMNDGHDQRKVQDAQVFLWYDGHGHGRHLDVSVPLRHIPHRRYHHDVL